MAGNGIPSTGEVDVAVVGAGAAGLAAAKRLLKRQPGLKVVVLEAAARPGGR
jgi:monoamine oxidase